MDTSVAVHMMDTEDTTTKYEDCSMVSRTAPEDLTSFSSCNKYKVTGKFLFRRSNMLGSVKYALERKQKEEIWSKCSESSMKFARRLSALNKLVPHRHTDRH